MHEAQHHASDGVDPHALAASLIRRIAVGAGLSFVPTAVFFGLLVLSLRLGPVGTQTVVLASFWGIVYTAVPVWLALVLVRREVGHPPGVPVERTTVPGLVELIQRPAASLGIAAPEHVLVTFNHRLDVDISRARPVLHLPATLLWEGRSAEVERILAPRLARVALMRDLRIHWSLRIGRRVRERLADEDCLPFGRLALGWIDSRLGQDLQRLDVACDAYAAGLAAARGLGPLASDEVEAEIAAEAWDLFLEQWVFPAWHRQLSPMRLMGGYTTFVARLEEAELIARPGTRTPGRPCLPDEPGQLDEQLSGAVSDWFVDLDQPDLTWEEYLARVSVPVLHDRAGALVSACSVATGRTVPASVDGVLDVLQSGWRDVVVSLLDDPLDRSQAVVDEFEAGLHARRCEVLTRHLTALATVTVIQQQVAVPEHDWLSGVLLRLPDGAPLRFGAEIAQYAEDEIPDGLRTALAVHGVHAEEPVRISGDDVYRRAFPQLVIPAVRPIRHPGRWRYMVAAATELVVVRDRSWGFGWSGTPARRKDLILQTPVDELNDAFVVLTRFAFADVVSARVESHGSGARWRGLIRTADRTVPLGGRGSGLPIAQLLRSRVGDRATVIGNVANDAADPKSTYLQVRSFILIPGLLVLLGCALVAGALQMSSDGTAVVGSCVLQRDKVDSPRNYACTGPVLEHPSETATLTVTRAVQPSTSFDVRVFEAPLVGTIVMEPEHIDFLLGFWVALGLLMTGVGSGFALRRRLHRQRIQHDWHQVPSDGTSSLPGGTNPPSSR